MRVLFGIALLLGVAAPVVAQNPPDLADSARVRLSRREFCFEPWRLFSCLRLPVLGTIERVTADSVVIRISRPRLGALAHLTTGVYRDSLVVWTPANRGLDLDVLVGHRSRGAQGLVGAGIGAGLGLVLSPLMCAFCTVEEWRHGQPALAAAFGLAGLGLGLLADTEKWRRVGPSRLPVPVVSFSERRLAVGMTMRVGALSH
ncbi:MAG: hypothetical protein JNJ80_22045 [Gemmatimonadetes bacterium]|nr:hypothetical protein [Gemmatimonadota bacterium]MCC7131009.1 hypothetical protein [Gemmatimonadales bacterium]